MMPRVTIIVIILLLTFSRLAYGQISASGGEQFIYVSVTTKSGSWIGGMKAENFRISDGKDVHEISSFHPSESASVGILIDTSGSSATRMDEAYLSMASFVRASKVGTEYFVMTFNVTQDLMLDHTEKVEDVLGALKKAAATTPRANTALFDAISAGLDKMSTAKHAKKVLIVFSDAVENSSKLSVSELKRKLRQSGVLLYNLNIQDPADAYAQMTQKSMATIDQLTALTGGKAIYPNNRLGLYDAAFTIADDLRHQYRIGFRPRLSDRNVKPDDWRKLDVKLQLSPEQEKKLGRLSVRTRRGYYPDLTSVK